MVGFRRPATAVIHSEDVFYFVRDLYLGIVTDELTHSSPKSDVIFQGVDKLLRILHGVDISDQQVLTNKDLGYCHTRVNGWGVRGDGACGYCFISSGNVVGWKPGCNLFSHGTLVDVTAHWVEFPNVFLMVSPAIQPK